MHIKSFNIWKLSTVLILVSLLIVACPSPLINSYYVQQQNSGAENGNHNGGNNGNNEEPGGGDVPVTPEEPAEPGKISMFSVILSNGKIAEPKHDTAVYDQLAKKLDASYGFPFGMFDSTKLDFTTAKFEIDKIDNYVTAMKYNGSIEWKNEIIKDKENGIYEQQIGGKDFKVKIPALTTTAKNIVFYRLSGKHPFGLYQNEEYEVYGEDGNPTGTKELLMKRFVFYYFTGKNTGQDLQNCLVAVDMYSKLIFSFAKPIKFKSVFGNQVPTKWASVDTHSVGPGGKRYRFYQYDPIGYVTEDGTFHLTDTYKENMAKNEYDPVYTGKSPYLGYADGTQEEEQEPPLNGTLTVKAKYLKNINVTDGWFSGDPEFSWDIRSRLSTSTTSDKNWFSLASQLTNNKYEIPKGRLVPFTGNSKSYTFSGTKGNTIELDSQIIELDAQSSMKPEDNEPVTEYEKPIIYFKYDKESKAWKPNGTNEKFVNGAVSFDADFMLTDGETKEFVITLPARSNQKMQLCYELSWKAE
ncbi:hypothetical protein HMPREF9194_01116 [Treponema maltophilum ATCC 51939]|uniref:Lipoprotein n=1 Tax=Treponema maltophilum ATCC 51939 TaxID=1125699 RepID=S3JXU0_TREMA|nr:hypothetical protein [Treponema maltophilum]EPF30793.1 hypothetical protein HMPREF9194_01116 [Treponema maltophilum ATCC 51939]